jgi:hypothetical protein
VESTLCMLQLLYRKCTFDPGAYASFT